MRRHLGVGLEPASGEAPAERLNRIDRAPVASARAFADHMRLVWLTPAMDGLFAGPASERRRFLDRLVLAIDPQHGARVNQFERALRGRNRLLEEGARNAPWLDALEREAAELGVAIAAARGRMRRAAASDDRRAGATTIRRFPGPTSHLRGEVEALASEHPGARRRGALSRVAARQPRPRRGGGTRADRPACRRSRNVCTAPKARPPAQSSTGEQKALLVGLVLAHARLVADMSGIAPLALLDEVAAHFDPRRRAALFDALERIGGQVFVTGADPAAFAALRARSSRSDAGARVPPASGVAGLGRQRGGAGAEQSQRAIVFGGEIDVEHQRRRRPGRPARRWRGSRSRIGPTPSRRSRARARRGADPRPARSL